METAVASVADKAVNSGLTCIKKHSKYVFCYNTYVQDLRQKLRDLECKREEVVHRVEEGKRNNEEQIGTVTAWLEKVEKAVENGNKILAEIDKLKNSCFFCGSVPKEPDHENFKESMLEVKVDESKSSSFKGEGAEDGIQKKDKLINRSSNGGSVLNPWTRYWTSKGAEEVASTVSELAKENFERCTRPSDPWGIVKGSYKGFDTKYFFPESRQSILRNIMEALNDDKIRIVGVWGLSGVGKSTLLDLVVEHVKLKKFGYAEGDEVAKATVSRTPNIERIQSELADMLGLSKLKEVSSMDQKANELKARLRQGNQKHLIILDDLARKIDLERIGIPFNECERIKLLLTSRDKEVLQSKMGSELNFELEPFKEEEAYNLFKGILGKDVNEDEEMMKLVKGLLTNECAGLPLSINQLAIRLRSFPPSGWKDTLMKLHGSNDLGVNNFIDEMLEFSDDVMNSNEVKSLLLLCGQIGTQIIPIDKLVIYGLSLGIFEKIDSLKEVRDRVDKFLEKLKSYHLLEDEKPGFIKIHDRVSDVALGVDSKAQHSVVVRTGDQLMNAHIKEDLRKCKSISLLDVLDIDEFPQGLSCPELNMFSIIYTEDHVTNFKP